MARLIEPDGTLGLEVSIEYAIQWCKAHPGWSWEEI